MLWLLISGFFLWLIFREFWQRVVPRRGYDTPRDTPVSRGYIACLLILAVAFASPPYRYWRLERMLAQKALMLTDGRHVSVHCNTMFDAFLDPHSMAAGRANFETGQIVFQYPFCDAMLGYLAHPERADIRELFSLTIFTHESMHVRGEFNETAAECQAVQRNYRAAKLLGTPDAVARRNAVDYYRNYYLHRHQGEGRNSVYFSSECAPGGALDERLSDSLWTTP